MEPALREAKAEERFQFERHGYFVADLRTPAAFNRAVSLRDSWSAPKAAGLIWINTAVCVVGFLDGDQFLPAFLRARPGIVPA